MLKELIGYMLCSPKIYIYLLKEHYIGGLRRWVTSREVNKAHCRLQTCFYVTIKIFMPYGGTKQKQWNSIPFIIQALTFVAVTRGSIPQQGSSLVKGDWAPEALGTSAQVSLFAGTCPQLKSLSVPQQAGGPGFP